MGAVALKLRGMEIDLFEKNIKSERLTGIAT
jgi:hypothetical protein